MKKALKEMINDIKGCKAVAGFDMVEIDGVFYPLPLVDGNSKIGHVWHASTLPTDKKYHIEYNNMVIDEKGTCPLECKGCYGTKGNYNYENVLFYIAMRTRLLRKYPEIYFQVCRAQITTENIKLIRLHATGDFIENEAAGWYKIFKDMPDLIGWTYTKCKKTGDIKRLNNLNNFNIVDSIIPGCGFNFGHIDYILNVYEKLKKAGKDVYICRCGIDKNQHCEKCGGCALNKYVLFIEHSTGYKAEKDPLYNTIKAIIEAQPLPPLPNRA